MIQLIAADLDGTLLDSRKQLSPRLFPLLHALRARGVRFAAASGRQYHNLAKLFAPVQEDMLFIAENGAVVCDGTRRLFADQMPKEHFAAPIQYVRTAPETSCVLCTADAAYIECTEDPVFVENAWMYYERLIVTEDLLAVLDTTPAFKLAVFRKGRAEADSLPQLCRYADHFSVVLSGADWVDLMDPQTNKGAALVRLAQAVGVPVQDTMAFGDYLNDTELLQAAGVSYCMENGHPDLKRLADHIAPSNDEDGVVRAILQYFDLTL